MDIDPDRAKQLFQAIITQALVDAIKEPKDFIRKEGESSDDFRDRCRNTCDVTDARDWLLNDMENFPRIASLAGYNPTDIRQRSRKLAANGWKPELRRAA